MRVVIANPPDVLLDGSHSVLFPSRCDWKGDHHPFSYYPYELAYLSALLKRDTKHEVVLLDGNDFRLNPEQYTRLIRSHRPDLLITECGHLTYSTMTAIRKELNVRGILGGPIATAYPEKAQADGWDTVAGEYEWQINSELGGNDGPADLDNLPYPEDDDILRILYQEEGCPVPGMVQVYASRGCGMACPYCTSLLYYGGYQKPSRVRTRKPDSVCDELEYLAGHYGGLFRGAFFNEEAHNADPSWLAHFASRLIDRGLQRFSYDAMCNYWNFTQALIELLALAGYRQLRIGLESLSPEVGKAIHKRIIPERFTRLLEWMKEAGIRSYVTAMVGAPGSSRAADLETLDRLHDLKARGLLGQIQFSTATPNPGTLFYEQARSAGWLISEDWDSAHWHSGVISYPHYSRDEIAEVFQQYYSLRMEPCSTSS